MSTPLARRTRRAATVAGLLAASALVATHAVAAPGSGTGGVPKDERVAPVVGTGAPGAVKDRYIVVMEDHSSAAATKGARDSAKARGGRVVFDYTTVLHGFAAELPAAAVKALQRNPHVAYLEADRTVTATGDQTDPTWGLDRIDEPTLPMDGRYHYDETGAGVTAYIIDTGVRASHGEFTGRMATGYSAINDGRGSSDCNGHGTHVAGTVGGTTYGVAKGVTLVPVRVLDCQGSGTTSGVIAGVDWVTSHHTSGPAVANMSLGGGVSSTLDSAVSRSISDGVGYAVAAGNDYGADACNGSPSRVAAALTVGSSTSSDARSNFSNIGSCLDLFAPGSSITSAWHTSDSATNTIGGTSMATPHVAGVAALYLDAHPSASPATVSSAIVGNATENVLSGVGTGSPNLLLHSLFTGGTDPDPEPPTGGNLLGNPGFESGDSVWSATSGVITSSTGRPARTGSWKAWFNGYGSSHTDTLSQSVSIPSGASATLSFWIRIDSSEYTTSTAYDRFRVQVVSGSTTSTLATYSNLNESTSYVQRSFDLSSYAGRTVTIRFVGTEDSSLQTSFVVDDTAVSVS